MSQVPVEDARPVVASTPGSAVATDVVGDARRVRSLDGLRALAVTAVLLYHLPSSRWVPGGWIGVDVFFVLSGYLITAQLLQMRGRPLRASIVDFYRRRARRILPALSVVLVVWALVVLLAIAGLLPVWKILPPTSADLSMLACTVLAAILFVSNWAAAFQVGDVPADGPQWAVGNLWSLSVEEQFYFVWPMVVLRVGRRSLAAVTVGLAIVSLAVPTFLSNGASASRLYFGTDSRCIALVAGAALAQLAPRVPRTASLRRLIFMLATVAGVMLVWDTHLVDAAAVLSRPLIFGEIAMLATAVVAACALFDPRGPLTWRPVQWVGRRSYAIYLWQNAFAAWFVPRGSWWWLVTVAGTLVVAELSWRLIESRWTRRSVVALPADGGVSP